MLLPCLLVMAFRATLQASRRMICRSRCMPVRQLSAWRPSAAIISTTHNRNDLSSSVIRQSACCLHTSSVMSSSHIVTIQDDKDFEAKVMKSQTPVLVDFFATYVTCFLITLSQVRFSIIKQKQEIPYRPYLLHESSFPLRCFEPVRVKPN